MRVLVTGSDGFVGSAVVEQLEGLGDVVVGLDRKRGGDIRNRDVVARAMQGREAVVHLAAAGIRPKQRTGLILATNVVGTLNLLSAAREAGVSRFIFLSSVNALGVFRGEGLPDFYPIDETHPARPKSPYGKSKLLGERLCQAFTQRHGLTTLCLRSPAVLAASSYGWRLKRWRKRPQSEWRPVWEYGAFIDVRDLCTAVEAALKSSFEGHATLFVCANDIATATGLSSHDLAAKLTPSVPWRTTAAHEQQPRRALVDSSAAQRLLGWAPAYAWGDVAVPAGPGPGQAGSCRRQSL